MPSWKQLFTTEKTEKRNRLSIAFLDTGISPVADFILPENRIIAFRDLVNGKKEPYDDNGHGTHVTGAKPKPSPTNELAPHAYETIKSHSLENHHS